MSSKTETVLGVVVGLVLAFIVNLVILGGLTWGVCWCLGVAFRWRYALVVPLVWMLLVGTIKQIHKAR